VHGAAWWRVQKSGRGGAGCRLLTPSTRTRCYCLRFLLPVTRFPCFSPLLRPYQFIAHMVIFATLRVQRWNPRHFRHFHAAFCWPAPFPDEQWAFSGHAFAFHYAELPCSAMKAVIDATLLVTLTVDTMPSLRRERDDANAPPRCCSRIEEYDNHVVMSPVRRL